MMRGFIPIPSDSTSYGGPELYMQGIGKPRKYSEIPHPTALLAEK
jgi:hypothetical protein